MKNDEVIQVNGLSKKYSSKGREVEAIKNLDFVLKQGEVLGLIGRNGSGKSTMLKVLGEMIKPDSGNALIRGKLAAVYDIGSGFHPDLSGRENVFVRGELLGLKRKEIKQKMADIISFSGLEAAIDQSLRSYSQGMFLRLAFSTLTILKADIILLDEVLHVGDQLFRRKINQYFRAVRQSGNQSFVIVSHELGFISDVADRLIWLEQGQKMAQGKPNEVIEAYLKYLGSGKDWKEVYEKQQSYLDYDGIRICKLMIDENHPGEETPVFHWEKEIRLMVEYELSDDLNSYEFILGIKDMYDHPLVLFSEAMQGDFQPKPSKQGKYQMEFVIPSKILDSGTYRIDFRIAQNAKLLIAELHDVLSFSVEKSYSSFTNFPLQRKPLIAPDIKIKHRSID